MNKLTGDKEAATGREASELSALLARSYSPAYEEEKLTALFSICAILCYGFGFDFAAAGFTLKAIFDLGCALRLSYKEVKEEREYCNE